MAMPTIKEARHRLKSWLESKMDADAIVIAELDGVGVGNSAQTLLADVDVTATGKTARRRLIVRLQYEGSDLFLDAGLELPGRTLQALGDFPEVPVPGVVGIELNGDVMGVPFMVTEHVVGRTVSQYPNYNQHGWLLDLPVERRGLPWRNAIEALAHIHRVPWQKRFAYLGQPHRGKPGLDQYMNMVEEWYRWACAGRPHPTTDLALEYLKAHRPADATVGLLWGDAQPSNVLWRDDLSVSAMLDWEMVALGPPEADLAWWLFFDDLFSKGMDVPRLEGLPERETIIGWYEAAAGCKLGDLHYYDVLAVFRMAIVCMRSVDRQIQLGRIPSTTTARTHHPTTRMLAEKIGAPLPEVGADFMNYLAASQLPHE